MKVIYTAIFLLPEEQDTLLRRVPPLHPQVHAGHVTLFFKTNEKQLEKIEVYLGKEIEVEVVAKVNDDRGQTVKVIVPPDIEQIPREKKDPKVHHVTLSCAEGVSPVYSNELLKGATAPLEAPFKLKGIVRHFER